MCVLRCCLIFKLSADNNANDSSLLLVCVLGIIVAYCLAKVRSYASITDRGRAQIFRKIYYIWVYFRVANEGDPTSRPQTWSWIFFEKSNQCVHLIFIWLKNLFWYDNIFTGNNVLFQLINNYYLQKKVSRVRNRQKYCYSKWCEIGKLIYKIFNA